MTKTVGEHVRIPCLDGLRAISILLVLLQHLERTRNFPAIEIRRHIDIGNFGVRVFFVISGFLITKLLIAEYRKSGTISLPMFYFRRTFRIFPAFYGLIWLLAVAEMIGWTKLAEGDLIHAMTFTSNYHQERAWNVGHLWSLAVEEQFYLLWPAIILFFRPRGALWIAVATVLLAPLVRVGSFVLWPEAREGIGETFQTVADTLATGCLLALAGPRLERVGWFTRIQSNGVTPVALFLLAMLVHSLHDRVSFSLPIGESITNVALALVVDAVLRNPTSRFGRFLELRPMVFIGVLSYSLYLVQQPFLNRFSQGWWAAFPLNIVLVAVCALCSYYLVEKPFLDLRTRIAKRWKKPLPATGTMEVYEVPPPGAKEER
jgi:peptidoglycan/LPS O-acetylase OafA/YrhL